MKKVFLVFFCFLHFFGLVGCKNNYLTHNAVKKTEAMIRWNKYSNAMVITGHYAKRPMILYFTSENCSACNRVEKETLSNRETIYLINSSYLPIKISTSDDKFSEAALFAGILEDDGVAVPHFVILSSTKTPLILTTMRGYVDSQSLNLVLKSSATIDSVMRIQETIDDLFLLPE